MSKATTQLLYAPDIAGDIRRSALFQYRDKPRWKAFFKAIGAMFQAAEDEKWDYIQSMVYANAAGATLDWWGAYVGAGPREGLNDDQYRGFIDAQVLVNTSKANRDTHIRILQLTTNDSVVAHEDLPPACAKFTVVLDNQLSDEQAARVGRLMESARPSGVGYNVTEVLPNAAIFDTPGALGFDSDGRFSRSLL